MFVHVELQEEWEKELDKLTSRFERELTAKKKKADDAKVLTLRLKKERDDLEKNLTVRRDKKKESLTRKLLEHERYRTQLPTPFNLSLTRSFIIRNSFIYSFHSVSVKSVIIHQS